MPENKPQADLSERVAESPISDVFEGRQPAAAEKNWAEKTLAPTLDKAPEKPIGAPTGTNVDERGQARFSTISNVPIRRLYTQADLPADWNYDQYPTTIPSKIALAIGERRSFGISGPLTATSRNPGTKMPKVATTAPGIPATT